jgi:hypothetical protein
MSQSPGFVVSAVQGLKKNVSLVMPNWSDVVILGYRIQHLKSSRLERNKYECLGNHFWSPVGRGACCLGT